MSTLITALTSRIHLLIDGNPLHVSFEESLYLWRDCHHKLAIQLYKLMSCGVSWTDLDQMKAWIATWTSWTRPDIVCEYKQGLQICNGRSQCCEKLCIAQIVTVKQPWLANKKCDHCSALLKKAVHSFAWELKKCAWSEGEMKRRYEGSV